MSATVSQFFFGYTKVRSHPPSQQQAPPGFAIRAQEQRNASISWRTTGHAYVAPLSRKLCFWATPSGVGGPLCPLFSMPVSALHSTWSTKCPLQKVQFEHATSKYPHLPINEVPAIPKRQTGGGDNLKFIRQHPQCSQQG